MSFQVIIIPLQSVVGKRNKCEGRREKYKKHFIAIITYNNDYINTILLLINNFVFCEFFLSVFSCE